MIKVGITQGDINGIGYEVILKTFAESRMFELCTPILYGSQKVALFQRKAMDLLPVSFHQINDVRDAQEGKLNIINCIHEEVRIELGQSTEAGGKAAFDALERATKDLKEGVIDVLVTAPINKNNIQRDDFHFPGHTEYLEERFGNGTDKSLMILAKDNLRVALVTGHIPLQDVPF